MYNHNDRHISRQTACFFSKLFHFRQKKKKKLVSYLVAPFQHIFLTLLHFVVDVEELNDAVLSHMVGILLGFFPFQWRPL